MNIQDSFSRKRSSMFGLPEYIDSLSKVFFDEPVVISNIIYSNKMFIQKHHSTTEHPLEHHSTTNHHIESTTPMETKEKETTKNPLHDDIEKEGKIHYGLIGDLFIHTAH